LKNLKKSKKIPDIEIGAIIAKNSQLAYVIKKIYMPEKSQRILNVKNGAVITKNG